MLSHGLVQIIESGSEAILDPVIEQISKDPNLKTMKEFPETDLREWGCYILNNLGNWLIAEKDPELARRYETRGRLRFKESVPLHEVVHALHILKNNTIDFVRDQGAPQTPLESYAEGEIEHLISEFFDWLEDHLVVSFEKALEKPVHAA